MYKTLIQEEKEPVSVAISQLRPSPLNTFDVNDLEDLITSITTFGVLTPLTICGPDDAGVYEILSGERRYKSVLKINEKMPGFLSEIPCYIVGSNDMPQVIKQLIIEESNLEAREDYNRDTHRFQLLKLYKQLADDGTIEEKEIISRLRESLKLSKRYSGMYMAIFRDGIPELMESVKSGKKVKESDDDNVHIPVSIASRIAKLSPEEQKKAIMRINSGEDPVDVINDIKKKSANKKRDLDTADKNKEADSKNTDISNMTEPPFSESVQETHVESDAETAETDSKFESEQIRQIAETGGEIDHDSFNVLDFMRSRVTPVDLALDTTEKLNQMRNAEKANSTENDDRKQVVAWIRRVTKKLDADEILDEEDISIIDQFSVLLDLYNSL